MSLHEKRETAPDQGEVPGAPIHNIASVKSEQNEEKDPVATDVVYPSGLKLALLMTSVFVAMFLVSLVRWPINFYLSRKKNRLLIAVFQDRLIVATAVPQITNEFNSAGDIGWYATAYLLTSCAFQLLFGKLYKVFSIKITFLSSIVLFEIGSAICGSAPNSIALIIGRAISGLGSGGILSGVVCCPHKYLSSQILLTMSCPSWSSSYTQSPSTNDPSSRVSLAQSSASPLSLARSSVVHLQLMHLGDGASI